MALTQDKVYGALKKVIDPETGLDIVSMGLIYKVKINQETGQVLITYTLTTPGCPLAPIIRQMMLEELAKIPELKQAKIELELVFDPPWHQGLMSEEVRAEWGLD